MITEAFLKERFGLTNEVCTQYSRKLLKDRLPEKGQVQYSRLPQDMQGLTLTSYVLFSGLMPPVLSKETEQGSYAEYLFSEEGLLMQKILHTGKGKQECYYVYEKERHIRLTYQENSFRELHCVCYDEGVLTEVFTAFFSGDRLSHLSGEAYENQGARIVSAANYRDYIPELPALIRREIQGMTVVMNPVTTSFTFDYEAGIVRTANPKAFANGKGLPKVLMEYAEGKNIDRYLLW